MYYDEEEQPYYEPSPADDLLMEYQNKMKEVLLTSVKYQIECFKTDNERLIAENKALKDNECKIRDKERQLEREKSDLMRQVRKERLSELMKDFEVVMYQAEKIRVDLPKCNKCNDKRKIEFKSPTGKKMYEDCKCNVGKTVYIPQEYGCSSFTINRDNKKMDMWFKEHLERDGDWYSYDNNSNYCKAVYNEEMDYKDIEMYHTFFKTKEECQKYCDWLNINKK
jgi:hypothetical protein